jgi:mannose-6-phosphate isomerase-like protein (cupin superfamily)
MTLLGNELTIKAGATDTDGALSLVEYTAAPGYAGPPLHLHRETADMFFVLEGALELRLGDETLELSLGSFALVPPGTVHTFSNPGAEPARFLSLMLPGGFEQYFRDLRNALGDGPPDPAVIGELAAKYDVQTVAAEH